ncbi:hypothetical protein FGF1_03680 [Flavobacteriaceae bacterium GF1]
MIKTENQLKKIHFPQGGDPTNCVLYCYMNLFNTMSGFKKYYKENGGHNEDEECKIINWNIKKFGIGGQHLVLEKLAHNGNHLYDGLTLGQLKRAMEFWPHETHDGSKWFIPIFVTVASKQRLNGRHRIMLLYCGSENKMVLMDPQVDRYVFLDGIGDLILMYKTIMTMDVVGHTTDKGVKAILFSKEHFEHLPLENI